MQIACPGCAAEYEVPTARLKPGQSVRCARCNMVWKPAQQAAPAVPENPPAPPPVEPETAAPALPAADAMQRLAASASPPPRRHRLGLVAAWLASVLVLAGAGVSTVIWREAVIRIWPPSGRILALLDHLPEPPVHMPGYEP
jgi:predicted Zn finger-like uncharacterized protein